MGAIDSGSRGLRSITLVTTKLDLGGAEVQAVRIGSGLVRRGRRVRIISLLPHRAFDQELTAAGIPLVDLGLEGLSTLPAAALRLYRELRRNRPDALIAFNYHANVLCKVVGRLAGVHAVVPSIRNEQFGGRLRERVESMTAFLAPITTTNSEFVGESLVRRGIVPRRKLRVVLNAAPDPDGPLDVRRRDALREEMGCGPQDVLWLAVGRFETQKDYPSLITAFNTLAARWPSARLALVGHGSLYREISALAAAGPAAARIRVVGRRTDVADLMRSCDAYVLSSVNEGMPNTVIEAMAAGLSIVATNVGGTGELLGGDDCGILVPARDTAALAAAMSRVMDLEPTARLAMGARSRARMLRRHGLETALDRWEELCREAGGHEGRGDDGRA